MTVPKHLLVLPLILFCLVASRPAYVSPADCNGFEYTTDASQESDQDLFKLTITANGGRQPYHYLLLDSKNNLVSKDFSKRIFEGLARGRYRCIVSDSQDCTKDRFIEVK